MTTVLGAYRHPAGAVLEVGREHPVKTSQVDSGARHERGEAGPDAKIFTITTDEATMGFADFLFLTGSLGPPTP